MVAIKIIRNKKRFHHQALVEVKLLDLLRRKDKDNKYNLVHMGEYFYFRNHLCITFELLWINLYELLKRNNFQVWNYNKLLKCEGLNVGQFAEPLETKPLSLQGFSNNLIRKFAYSMLLCLRMLHREKIIHCDFKPVSHPTRPPTRVQLFGQNSQIKYNLLFVLGKHIITRTG